MQFAFASTVNASPPKFSRGELCVHKGPTASTGLANCGGCRPGGAHNAIITVIKGTGRNREYIGLTGAQVVRNEMHLSEIASLPATGLQQTGWPSPKLSVAWIPCPTPQLSKQCDRSRLVITSPCSLPGLSTFYTLNKMFAVKLLWVSILSAIQCNTPIICIACRMRTHTRSPDEEHSTQMNSFALVTSIGWTLVVIKLSNSFLGYLSLSGVFGSAAANAIAINFPSSVWKSLKLDLCPQRRVSGGSLCHGSSTNAQPCSPQFVHFGWVDNLLSSHREVSEKGAAVHFVPNLCGEWIVLIAIN